MNILPLTVQPKGLTFPGSQHPQFCQLVLRRSKLLLTTVTCDNNGCLACVCSLVYHLSGTFLLLNIFLKSILFVPNVNLRFFFPLKWSEIQKLKFLLIFFSRFVAAVSLLLREDDQSQWTVSGHVTRPGQWSVFSGVKNIFVEVKTCSRICVSLEYF